MDTTMKEEMMNEDRTAVIEARLQRLQDTIDNLAYHQVAEGYTEVGRLLGVSPPTAKAMIEAGEIPHTRVGGRVFVQRGDALRLRKPSAHDGRWELRRTREGYVLVNGPLRVVVSGDRVLVTRAGRPTDVRRGTATDTPAKFLEILERNL